MLWTCSSCPWMSSHTVFYIFEGDLGCTDLLCHDIPLLDDTPVRQRYWHIPPSEYEVVRAHTNQLLETQVIQESCSPYASPIVLGKKKGCSLRMCMDYRQLNSKTLKDVFPLPRIEEVLDMLTGARWSQRGISIRLGLFECNRMLFGLCNAPVCSSD